MIRTTAVARILYALGNRPAGTALDDQIVLRLQEAQRDLERGKSLPWFLMQDFPTTLATGDFNIDIEEFLDPQGGDFLRETDVHPLHYTTASSDIPVFLREVYSYRELVEQFTSSGSENENVSDLSPRAPTVYWIDREDHELNFFTEADQDYTLVWTVYQRALPLTSDIENAWLLEAPEWLIGEAGRRIAMDLRNPDAVALFTEMRQAARAATFGDEIAFSDYSGPLQMGANL